MDTFDDIAAAQERMTRLLDALPATLEPHIKAASDRIYEELMLTTQMYLKDNATFNIQAQIDCAEREIASLRTQCEAERARAEAAEAEVARLREALRACRRAVSSMNDEPRRNVREIVDAAIEEHDRAARAHEEQQP